MMSFQRTRVHNPQGKKVRPRKQSAGGGKKRRAQAAAKRTTNPGPVLIELAGLVGNPQRGKGMKKRKSTKRRPTSNPARRFTAKRRTNKRRSNPMGGHRTRSTRRRRNPNFAAKGIGSLKSGFWALVGLVLTRQIPQLLLKDKNTGPMGYAANVAAMFGASFLISKFGGPDAGGAALVGGGLYTVNRVIQEHLSPVGKVLSLQGVGDAMALGELFTDNRAYFPVPVATDNNRMPVIPPQIRAAAPMPIAAGSGMGSWRGGRRGNP